MAIMRRAKKAAAAEGAKPGLRDYACIIAPVITEKSSVLHGPEGCKTVAFYVQRDASKLDIKRAVERVFKVQVAKIRTTNTMGKLKRTTRAVGRTPERKKAYVTLKAGSSIDIIEGV